MFISQIGGVFEGLGAAVDILGGPGGDLVQVVCAAGEGLGRNTVAAYGELQAAGGLDKVAVDVDVVAEVLTQ
jgi:hypothetical protein